MPPVLFLNHRLIFPSNSRPQRDTVRFRYRSCLVA
jgi:hypothetical protein